MHGGGWRSIAVWSALGASWIWLGGCGSNARVQLAAADAVELISRQLTASLREFDADLRQADDTRERAVTRDFIARVRVADLTDVEADRHASAFEGALARVREDRLVTQTRVASSMENVRLLAELATGLRQLAEEELSLQDESRRFLEVLISTRSPDAGGPSGASR